MWTTQSLWAYAHFILMFVAMALIARLLARWLKALLPPPPTPHKSPGDTFITHLTGWTCMISLNKWLQQFSPREDSFWWLCKTWSETIWSSPHEWCQGVCLTDENLCSCERRSVLGWPSVPFGSDIFTPSACCWRWEAAGREATDVWLSWLINSRI